ncbi:unnamed protein product [Brassica napus]|uniref:(rape) hypothetical protein n=1 Tax=Brassica napus TaxID=3708 RepID=A0A816UWV0_BRANA|nr:unnamed protein product [Brassica napus]
MVLVEHCTRSSKVSSVVASTTEKRRQMHDYVTGLSGNATLETVLTLLSQFIKEDVQKTNLCKDWGFKYKATAGHSDRSCFWGKNKSEIFQTFSAFDLFLLVCLQSQTMSGNSSWEQSSNKVMLMQFSNGNKPMQTCVESLLHLQEQRRHKQRKCIKTWMLKYKFQDTLLVGLKNKSQEALGRLVMGCLPKDTGKKRSFSVQAEESLLNTLVWQRHSWYRLWFTNLQTRSYTASIFRSLVLSIAQTILHKVHKVWHRWKNNISLLCECTVLFSHGSTTLRDVCRVSYPSLRASLSKGGGY